MNMRFLYMVVVVYMNTVAALSAQTFVLDASTPALRELMLCIGMPVDSTEFKKVEVAHQLHISETRQREVALLGGGFRKEVSMIYRGKGIRVYALKREMSQRVEKETSPKKQGGTQMLISHVSLLLAACDENLWSGDRWEGDLPAIVMPDSPAMLLRTYKSIEMDRTEERYLNVGAERVFDGTRRTIRYAFEFRKVDSFPFTFVFQDDALAVLMIHPTFHEITVVGPTPP